MEHVQSILKLAKDAGKEDLAKQLEEFVLVQNNLPEGNSKEDVIKNYLKKHGHKYWSVKPFNAFRCACKVGDLAFVKYLCANFNLNVEDARGCDNYALRCAAENGHLLVVKYLFEKVGLTIEDARACDNEALQNAAYNGHTEIVKYLFEEAGLTIDDAQPCDNEALQNAAENGHTEIVKYLFEKVGLSIEDVRDCDNDALRSAAFYGHTEVVKYLIEEVGLGVEDVRDCDMQDAAHNGHTEVVEYLQNLAATTPKSNAVVNFDVYQFDCDLTKLRERCEAKQREIAQKRIENMKQQVQKYLNDIKKKFEEAVEQGMSTITIKIDRDFVKPVRGYLESVGLVVKRHSDSLKVMLYEEEYVDSSDDEDGCEESEDEHIDIEDESNAVVNFDVYQFDYCDLTKLRERCETKQREIAQKRLENMKQQVQKYLNDIKKKFEEAVEQGISTITIKIDRDFVKPVRGYLESVGLVVKRHSDSLKVMLYEEVEYEESDDEDDCESSDEEDVCESEEY